MPGLMVSNRNSCSAMTTAVASSRLPAGPYPMQRRSSLAPPFLRRGSGRPAAEALGALDRDRLGAGLLSFGQPHGQDAICEGGLDLLSIDRDRQADALDELALANLLPVPGDLASLLFWEPIAIAALDGQDVLLQGELEILGLSTGNDRLDHQLVTG